MTKREQILAIIRANVAKQGRVTHHEIRLYVENRISMAAFRKACDEGGAIHRRGAEKVQETAVPCVHHRATTAEID